MSVIKEEYKFTNIQVLKFSDHSVTQCPSQFMQLTNLKEFSNKNNISM